MKSTFIALSAAIVAISVFGMNKPDYIKHAMQSLSLADAEEPVALSPRLVQQSDSGVTGVNAPVFREIKRSARPVLDTVVTAATAATVDESALRYFASRGDTARLQAEISRLKALYPDWVPPKDPLAVPQNEDKQLETMWDLYAQGRYAEVRKAIAERQIAEPAWKPPADLIDRLTVAEARTRLINASDLKQYDTVVRIGSETPSLLTCSEVDVLWRVAEAFFRTDKAQRATDAYSYILNNCQNAAERLATVQKAAAILPAKSVEDLLAKEKTAPDGTMEFDSIRDDLARRFVAEANADGKLVVPPQYLARVEHLAETGGLASDALLLGWYHLPRGDMEAAEKWFRKARDKEDTASASQGLALTLIDRNDQLAAEDTMYRWRDDSKDAKAVYLAATANLLALEPPVAISGEVLKRIAAEVIKSRDASTAQQFGWYARALNQPQTALQWFRAALGWKLDDEPSAYGLAVTYQQLDDLKGLSEIQRLWAGRSERIAKVGEVEKPETANRQLPVANETVAVRRQPRKVVTSQDVEYDQQEQVAVTRPRRTVSADRGCKSTINPQTLAPEAALTRGWCLMERNRPMEAAAAFEVGMLGSSAKTREDAAYGQSLAYLRAGLSAKAAVSAIKAPQNRQRAFELQQAILADKAVAAFDAGRSREAILILDQLRQIGPERTDLLSLRGYAYLRLKRYADARRVFEALAAIGNRDGQRGLGILYQIFNDKD
ncbi:cellulose synthase [Rhizobium sp. Root1204]|uniref:tetratricopeptide repeat protein n=1 Tax=Rhizobium sp. Root1204 TaxID=1736428 RepID=UPI0007127954|nr:cellulose synthase [Rhizobium sp. Root1204]KQV27402.1 cellulose synthase [Rhizobium sp. Root1204]